MRWGGLIVAAGCLAGVTAAVFLHPWLTSAGGLTYARRPGERLTYEIEFTSAAESDLSLLFQSSEPAGSPDREETAEPAHRTNKQSPASLGPARLFRTSLKGRLFVTTLERASDRLAVSYRLDRPELSFDVDGRREAAQEAAATAALGRDIFAELDSQGRVGSLYFAPDTDEFSMNLFRALAACSQFVVPEQKGARGRRGGPLRWEIEEEDQNGVCLARYDRLTEPGKKAGQAFFSKTKLSYVRPPAEAGSASSAPAGPERFAGSGMRPIPTDVRPTGMMTAAFDTDRARLLSLEGTEEQEVSMAGKAFARSRTSLRMELLEADSVSKEELSAGRRAYSERRLRAAGERLSFNSTEAEKLAAIERNDLGSATKESLLSELAAAEAAGKESDTELYLKFKALAELQPEVCPELGRVLAGAGPGSLTLNVLSLALGSAGHGQAQAALVEAIRAGRDGSEDSAKLRSLIECLGMVSDPTEEAEESLREAAGAADKPGAGETALMLLGNMARNLEAASPQRAERIVDWLLEEIKRESGGSDSTRRTKVLLLSLGNSGSERAQAAVMEFARSPDVDLRATAVAGLRWMESPAAEERMIDALLNDAAPSVRIEAVFALSFRGGGGRVLEAAKKAFLRDEAAEVRLAVLRNLLGRAVGRSDVRRMIEQAAAGDASEEVRRAAADVLKLAAGG